MLQVKDNDQLPQQLCLSCVSELNKCFAFREKCVRTDSTLRTYLDLSSDSEVEASETFAIKKLQPKAKLLTITESKEDAYEEIEVTQDMIIDVTKSQRQVEDANTDMVLEMQEITNILNPTASASVKSKGEHDNELVFIIQDVSDGSRLFQTSPNNNDKLKEVREKFKCDTCEMEFVRKKNYDNHMRRFHEGDEEDQVSPGRKRLRLRIGNEKDNEQMKQELEENPEAKRCKTCGALYLNEKSLRLHERRNACQQENYHCTVCEKIFTDQSLFTEHTRNHPQQQEETKAEELVDPTKKFTCSICPKSFKMLSTLKDHLRTHTGEFKWFRLLNSR